MRRPRLVIAGIAVLLMGGLLYLVGGISPAALQTAAQGARVLQVWPDQSIGVAAGQLGAATDITSTQRLPMGVCRAASGEVVQARTYLHFPLDVFPPGTDVTRAILYVYADSGSGSGEVTLGLYRVVEGLETQAAWEGAGWRSDPATWPALLSVPLAVATARITAAEPLPEPLPEQPTATPSLTWTVAPPPTATLTATPILTPYWQMTLTPPPTFTPTPTLPLTPTAPGAPVVPLVRGEGTWLTWDVTALLRAWLAGETPNRGLALAAAPLPDAAPETAGDLVVARWFTEEEANTRPYIIAEFEVLPVTPTPPTSPLATPRPGTHPILPSAGAAGERVLYGVVSLWVIGAVLLLAGLRRRSEQNRE